MRNCLISGPINPIECGTGCPLTIIAGPCVLEGRDLSIEIGQAARAVCAEFGLPYIFKASFDKANRTSIGSPRGPGFAEGLDHLAWIRQELGTPVLTDVHSPEQCEAVAQVVDVLQIPAFLCRQTDLLIAAAEAASKHGRTVNIKKGQFLSPEEMAGPVGKVREAGCDQVLMTERGTFFGYHRLVNDFIGLGDLLDEAVIPMGGRRPPVVFDCTHSAQLPGATKTTGGRRERVPLLARAATAAGVDSLFVECHPKPEQAPSDASNMLHLHDLPALIASVAAISTIVRGATVGQTRS